MKKRLGKSLVVQGTDDAPIPTEVRDFYEGKGIRVAFLRKRYGFGKSMAIRPTDEKVRARMVDTG